MAQPGKQRWTFFPLISLPSSLDIVWCRFPTDELPSVPGPKARPALVRSVYLTRDHQRAYVEVTYGTSNIKEWERVDDLILANASELAAMGLPQQTRFDLDRTVRLPWAAEFFETRPGHQNPILGHLIPTAVDVDLLHFPSRHPRACRGGPSSVAGLVWS